MNEVIKYTIYIKDDEDISYKKGNKKRKYKKKFKNYANSKKRINLKLKDLGLALFYILDI